MQPDLLLLVPRVVQYACAVVTLILLVQLWRMTRQAGFAVLAGVLLVGYVHTLAIQSIVTLRGAAWLQTYFACFAAITAALVAFAWWRIFVWFRQAYSRNARP